jgi:hypothetical protein
MPFVCIILKKIKGMGMSFVPAHCVVKKGLKYEKRPESALHKQKRGGNYLTITFLQ